MLDEATTPNPEEKEATPSEEQEAITSGTPKQENQTPPEDKVVELEEQVEALKKQVKQSQDLQRQADRKGKTEKKEREKLESRLQKIRNGEVGVEEQTPDDETTNEKNEKLEAKVKIQGLIIDNPDYQQLMAKDITLRKVLKNNPFALIGDYFDLQDAVDQIRDMLDERISSLQKIQPKEEKKEGEGSEIDVGLVQPKEGLPTPSPTPTATTPDEKLEESIKSKMRIT